MVATPTRERVVKTFTQEQKHELLHLTSEMLGAFRDFTAYFDSIVDSHEPPGYEYRNERLIDQAKVNLFKNIMIIWDALEGEFSREYLVRFLTECKACGYPDDHVAIMMAEAIEVSENNP